MTTSEAYMYSGTHGLDAIDPAVCVESLACSLRIRRGDHVMLKGYTLNFVIKVYLQGVEPMFNTDIRSSLRQLDTTKEP
jgi:hypothetical protein